MIDTARRFAALGAAVACSGCISLLPERSAPAALYTLDPGADAPDQTAAASGAIVAVDAPAGLNVFLGDDIAWREDNSVSFVAGASWAGQARLLLQRMLVEYLEASGGLRSAAPSGEGARPTHLVRWDISAFEVHTDGGAPQARFIATAQLVHARSRELIATKRVQEIEPLSQRSSRAAAAALREAARRGAQTLSEWVVREAQAAPAPTMATAAAEPAGS